MVWLTALFVAAVTIHNVGSFSPNAYSVVGGSTTTRLAQTQTASDASRVKRVASLTEWAKTSEIKLGGVGIAPNESGAGLGLMASRPTPSNSLVVEVPSNIALTVESPGVGPDADFSRDWIEDRKLFRDLPWFVQFSAYLYGLDQVSSTKNNVDMRPWLDSLPRSFDTPIHWTAAARDELQYPHLIDTVRRQEVEWKRLYDKLMMNAASPKLNKMSFDDFVWGCECARSRAFCGGYTGSAFNPLVYAFTLLLVTAYVGLNLGTLEQAANGAALVVCTSILKDFVVPKLFKTRRYVICPIIDMANHKSVGHDGDVSFEFFGDAYSLAATKDVPDKSELYISYGARSNDQLLQYYGFVEHDNPHDVYVMPPLREWDIDALEAACSRTFSPGRLQKLDRAGLLGSTTASDEDTADVSSSDGAANPAGGVVITRATGIDPAVMQALRALVSSEEEWKDAGEAIGNFAAELSGGAENERLARLAAKAAIEKELASKPTTLKEDEALLKTAKSSKGMDASREEILAIEFRIEKRKLLAQTLDKLN